MSHSRRGQRGQGTVELIACIPIVIICALVGWQLAAVAWAGIRAEEQVRRAGIAATATPGRIGVVVGRAKVPGPLGRRLTVRIEGVVGSR